MPIVIPFTHQRQALSSKDVIGIRMMRFPYGQQASTGPRWKTGQENTQSVRAIVPPPDLYVDLIMHSDLDPQRRARQDRSNARAKKYYARQQAARAATQKAQRRAEKAASRSTEASTSRQPTADAQSSKEESWRVPIALLGCGNIQRAARIRLSFPRAERPTASWLYFAPGLVECPPRRKSHARAGIPSFAPPSVAGIGLNQDAEARRGERERTAGRWTGFVGAAGRLWAASPDAKVV
ncbi:hypothetical protein BD779DRAFT_1788081 [Infundibulicybe gibba]|nr:hypothetical protein BD779DRAFT_1788081 [Infundibulicybe gibba]